VLPHVRERLLAGPQQHQLCSGGQSARQPDDIEARADLGPVPALLDDPGDPGAEDDGETAAGQGDAERGRGDGEARLCWFTSNAAARRFSVMPSAMASRGSAREKNCGDIAKARNQTSGSWLWARANSAKMPAT
jgi:hypothetical protein